MGCLAEMTVAHPTSGSFGAIAEKYMSPMAGYLVRYSYWIGNVLAVGVEVSAVSVYMNYWFPTVPGIVWILLFAGVLIYVNATSVNTFATFEYWFSFIKISAIVGFILLGAYVLFGSSEQPHIGPENFVNEGGFFPFGLKGMWIAVFISLFSFLGTEMIAVTSGEAKDPDAAVPKALKATVFRLSTFYVLTIGIMLMIVPVENGWDRGKSIRKSDGNLEHSRCIRDHELYYFNGCFICHECSALCFNSYDVFIGAWKTCTQLFRKPKQKGCSGKSTCCLYNRDSYCRRRSCVTSWFLLCIHDGNFHVRCYVHMAYHLHFSFVFQGEMGENRRTQITGKDDRFSLFNDTRSRSSILA